MLDDAQAVERGMRRVADRRIREAMRRGAFDNLPGRGKPIPGLEEPWDLSRWVHRWLSRHRLSPGALESERRQAEAQRDTALRPVAPAEPHPTPDPARSRRWWWPFKR